MITTDTYWYESLTSGKVLSLPDIDCSAERISRHADLFGAHHPINTSSNNRFGRAIAHGPYPVAQAMASIGNVIGESLVAMDKLGPWRFLTPAFVGDTLTASVMVLERRASSRSGTICVEIRICSSDGQVSQVGEASLIVLRKPKDEANQ